MTKIVICGGHLTPALALIEQLVTLPKVQIIFFGRKYSTEGSESLSAEYRLIREAKIPFFAITAGRLPRKFTKFSLLSIAKIPLGFFLSFLYLAIVRPKIVVSFGGYLSVPVIFGAWLLGIDSLTHEQAVVPGIATRINSLFVKKILLSWPESSGYFEKNKVKVIGNLLRKTLFLKNPKSKVIASFLRNSGTLVYITGGNQGSHFLNQLVFNNLATFAPYRILHQVGTANWQDDWGRARKIKSKNYLAADFIAGQDVGAILNKAQVVVARAGANTVWELVILKKPAILIPLPIEAASEQLHNAEILKEAGAAIILEQDKMTFSELEEAIDGIIKNYAKFKKALNSLSRTLPQDATKELANYILRHSALQ